MDPELAAAAPMLPAASLSDIATVRATYDAMSSLFPPVDFIGIEVENRQIPGSEGAPDVTVRMLAPSAGGGDRAAVLDLHGGGMVVGDAAMDDAINVVIAREVGALVVSVDYRLAPEHPYPAALEDGYAALVWLAENAASLGVDASRIAILGDSGGGTLAAAVALVARDRGGPALAMQVLIEPALDDRLQTDSMLGIGRDSVFLNHAQAADIWRHYLGDQEPTGYAAPARMSDLADLPPTYLTVNELDPLRDEGLEYARRLLRAGVPTELHCWPGAFHGFTLVPTAAVTQRARSELFGALSRGLAARVWA